MDPTPRPRNDEDPPPPAEAGAGRFIGRRGQRPTRDPSNERRAGHADLSFTQRIHVHPEPQSLRAGSKKLNELLG
ncbi:hypothetical protein DTB58_18730 [Streptomyces griseus]|nr:hypothetical protein [Streptomyces griseus]